MTQTPLGHGQPKLRGIENKIQMLPFDIPSIINGLILGLLSQMMSILLSVGESDLNIYDGLHVPSK